MAVAREDIEDLTFSQMFQLSKYHLAQLELGNKRLLWPVVQTGGTYHQNIIKSNRAYIGHDVKDLKVRKSLKAAIIIPEQTNNTNLKTPGSRA